MSIPERTYGDRLGHAWDHLADWRYHEYCSDSEGQYEVFYCSHCLIFTRVLTDDPTTEGSS